MRNSLEVIGLEDLGLVRMRGVEAVRFLQGQVSNDVAQLSAERSILAGYHNPQGRAIALLRLVQWDADDFLAVVPRELAAVVASRLSKFVLRAKVKISDESSAWQISGLVDTTPTTAPPTSEDSAVPANESASHELPSSVSAQVRDGGTLFVCVSDRPSCWLVISPTDAADSKLDYPAGSRETWRRLEVVAGQPQVYAATSEEFVAQMLNLDVLNAIAFDKGCYTGQEVIARTHYRGRVKRRMQRFVSREARLLAPGDSGQLADGRAFKVVQAAQLADGRCDFLAVAPLVGTEREDSRGTPTEAASGTTTSTTTTAHTTVALLADQVPLPYSLPD
jgi:folate-binding protein YgfZ